MDLVLDGKVALVATSSSGLGLALAEEQAKVTGSIPLGRMADPREFGRVAAFLVSPVASYITGTMIQVDGGDFRGLL